MSEQQEEHPEPSQRGEIPDRAQLVLRILVSLMLLAGCFLLFKVAPLPFERADIAIRHPWFQMDNEEGALLFQSLELKRGHSIYHSLSRPPFVAGTYPPVYMLVASLITNSDNPTLLGGRTVSSAACIGIAVVIMSIIAIRTRLVAAGLFAAMAFVSSFEVYCWVPYFRVDFLAIFLSILGLGCVAVSPRERSSRVLAILLFAAAFFTKQTELAAPAAVTTYFLLNNWRNGVRFLLGLVIAIGIPFAVLTIITGGQFARHTIIYNMNTFHPHDLVVWARHAWLFSRWLIISGAATLLSLALVAFAARRAAPPQILADTDPELPAEEPAGDGTKQPLPEEASPAPGYLLDPLPLFMLFSLFSFLAIGKAGSAENYLLEPLAAVVLCSADAVGRLLSARYPARAVASVGALAITCLLVVHSVHITQAPIASIAFSPQRNPGEADFRAAARVVSRLEKVPTDEATWCELGLYNILAGRGIYFQPFIMSELARQGRWNPAPFYEAIKSHKFKILISNYRMGSGDFTDGYTPEMIALITHNYDLDESASVESPLWKYFVYRPKAPARERLDIVMARER